MITPIFYNTDPIQNNSEVEYYIQNGWVGNAMAWWAFDSRGYTTEINKAKRFTETEAKDLIQRPDFRAWLCDHVDNTPAAVKITIDGQYLDKKFTLKP